MAKQALNSSAANSDRMDLGRYLGRLTGRSSAEQDRDPSPRRVASMLAVLGNPHRHYRVVHLTGTNGKGSTAAMTAAVLGKAGLRVGLFTSPHLSRVTERVMIDGRRVSGDELTEALARVAAAAERLDMTPGWFEAITAAAFCMFADAHVEVAVIEVGKLGALDATNVLDAETVVITNVALDHQREAGGERREIATAKADIVAPGSTLILGEPDPSLRSIFAAREPARILTRGEELLWSNRWPSTQGSRVDLETPLGLRRGVRVGMIGAHQCDNALLALAAAEAVLERRISTPSLSVALEAVCVNGRFEIWREKPLVILDGAHNAAAAVALRQAVSEISVGMSPRILVYGQSRGRDPFAFLRECGVGRLDRVVITEVPDAAPGEDDVRAAKDFGAEILVVPNPGDALARAVALAGSSGLVVATGSLRLVAALRDQRPDDRDRIWCSSGEPRHRFEPGIRRPLSSHA